MTEPSLRDVESFWNKNPLFSGEYNFHEDSPTDFFEAHNLAYFHDVFVGVEYKNTFTLPKPDDKVLDLGCGIGFWTELFVKKLNVTNVISADLTDEALRLCKIRVPETNIKKENAEALSFMDGEFDHVNCQGVVHHTPDTQSCINEICRLLTDGGTASISVYYKNSLLRLVAHTIPIFRIFAKLFLKDTGRGRDFSHIQDINDLVRFYDGSENPIGKAFTELEFRIMLENAGFKDIKFNYFFFPFRFFKIKFPKVIQGRLVHMFPFMIVANLRK